MYGASNTTMNIYRANNVCLHIYGAFNICMNMYGAANICLSIHGAYNICMNICGAYSICMNIFRPFMILRHSLSNKLDLDTYLTPEAQLWTDRNYSPQSLRVWVAYGPSSEGTGHEFSIKR